MKNRINCVIRKLTVAAIIVGLTIWLPLPARQMPSASAQTADGPVAALSALQGERAVDQLKQQGLYDSLQEAVAAAHYELRWEDRPALNHLPAAYHAPNPAQRLSAYFTPSGLHLTPHKTVSEVGAERQVSAQAEWQATMRLIGYGYGDQLAPVGEAVLAARDNRIEYRRAWPLLTEWYVNKTSGLEQGFTLAAPPGDRSEGARLRLELAVTGSLRAELAEGVDAIALQQATGESTLRYSNLHAYDAEERELPAQMKLSGAGVILEVDDRDAAYPVTIDPTFTQQAQLIPPFFNIVNGQPDYQNGGEGFGRSVAISGETAVVGVPSDDVTAWNQGSAYVFVRNGATWSQQARLIPSSVAAGYWFGYSVAISGDTVVVGTPEYFSNNAGPGSAYVFVRSGANWSEQDILRPSNGAVQDFFGHSVAISGDTIVVGAPYHDVGGNGLQGSAYVFVRSGASWPEQAHLTASDGGPANQFGGSVAISGNTIVVGAHYANIIGTPIVLGAAYVFERSGASWPKLQKLTASDGAAGDYFGVSVAISGNTVLVGAPGDDIGARSNQGSAYLFVRYGFGQQFSEQAPKLTANDGEAEDKFGSSVAISGNTVAVGAPQDDVFVNNVMQADQGSVYIFTRAPITMTWNQTSKLNASGQASNLQHDNDLFGSAVALGSGSATTLIVGAPQDMVVYYSWPGHPIFQGRTGSAYVFVM